MSKSRGIFDEYVQPWMPKDPELLPLYIGIDKVVKQFLGDDKIDDEKTGSKIIADPLLGYIHLMPIEVAIIDTKLFQRLRKISQVGLANLVFPTLGYSRFEHSLGVLGRLNQVLFKLIENNARFNLKDASLKQTIDEYLTAIRFAALLHDVGHCLFSHCSERVISQITKKEGYPSAHEIEIAFQNHFKKSTKVPIAEIFSIAIIGSVRLFEFLKTSKENTERGLETILRHTATFILGLPIEDDPSTVFLSQLMSSGLDVDKIDYMAREQHYTGIKLEIDFDRIFSKLRVFDIKYYDLPFQLQYLKKFYKPDSSLKVLGFERGGQFAFEEFCVARLALHVKVYLHQKVRAAEGQLSEYLKNIAASPVLQELHNWLKLPEAILEYPELINRSYGSDGTLFNNFELSPSDISNFKSIENREILQRSYAFGPNNSYSDPSFSASGEDSDTLYNYFNQFNISELREKIINEAQDIIDLLSDDLDSSVNISELHQTIIDVPRLINIQQGHESLYFERATFIPVRWTIPIDKILIYFQENRALAYIFSPKNVASFVSIASEKIIFLETQKVYGQESLLSVRTFREYSKYKNLLAQKNYYKPLPRLKPLSEYLKNAEAVEKIKNLEEKLRSFKSFSNEHITINNITTFVNQFPESLQDACLDFLLQLEIYHENLLAGEIDDLLKKLSGKGKVAVTPLGALSDSGGRLSYNLKPTVEKYGIELTELLSDDLILENDTLILFDDNVNSGLQVVNIFAGLLGEINSLEEMDLNETHNRPLKDENAIAKLKSMPIYIVYTLGFEGIQQKVIDLLNQKLGFNPSNIHIKIHREFRNNEKIFSGSESKFNHKYKTDLRNALSQIGETLLRNDNKKEEKVQSCKLGYASAEAMVLFPYNIPTMTITAIWYKGMIDDVPWIPLAERKKRMKDGKLFDEY